MGATDRPSFQFYPGDWRRDINVRTRSLAARGLWLEMLCLMHDGEPYGYLAIGGKPISPDQLAGLVGRPAREVKLLLQELADVQVYSVSESGLIFSRRMVRDEELRRRRGEHGMKGAEHGWKGADHGWKGGRPRKPPIEPPIEPGIKPPPSSSSSSSSSSETTLGGTPPGGSNGKHGDPLLVEFETEIKPVYPKRDGDHRWKRAFSGYRSARKAGEPLDVVRAGVERYSAYCERRHVLRRREIMARGVDST
jgi:hypothetical protein